MLDGRAVFDPPLIFPDFFAIPSQTALHGWSTGVFRVGRSSFQRAAPAFDVVWRMSALDALAFLLLLLLLLPLVSSAPTPLHPFSVLFFLSYSFAHTSLFLPFHSAILRCGSSRFLVQERESRMTDSVESFFKSANRKLETSDRAATGYGHDKKVCAAAPRRAFGTGL